MATKALDLRVSAPLGLSFVIINGSGGLVRVAGDGTSATTITNAVSGSSVAQEANGNFVVATTDSLKRVTPDGVVSSVASAPADSQWVAVAVDPLGNLIVADNKVHQIVRVLPDGSASSVIASYSAYATANVFENVSLQIDNQGNYIVAEDNGGAQILKVNATGAVTPLTLSGATLPAKVSGLTFDGAGNYLLLDAGQQILFTITPAGVVNLRQSGVPAQSFGVARNPVN